MSIPRHVIVLGLLALLGVAFWTLFAGYVPDAELNRSALYYAEKTAAETGAQNVVAAIIVTYRGLDTLGEVTVLFLTAAIVGLVLSTSRAPRQARPVPACCPPANCSKRARACSCRSSCCLAATSSSMATSLPAAVSRAARSSPRACC